MHICIKLSMFIDPRWRKPLLSDGSVAMLPHNLSYFFFFFSTQRFVKANVFNKPLCVFNFFNFFSLLKFHFMPDFSFGEVKGKKFASLTVNKCSGSKCHKSLVLIYALIGSWIYKDFATPCTSNWNRMHWVSTSRHGCIMFHSIKIGRKFALQFGSSVELISRANKKDIFSWHFFTIKMWWSLWILWKVFWLGCSDF